MSFGAKFDASRHVMQKAIVAELMKVQTLYQRDGLELRLEEHPSAFDGFWVWLRMPGRDDHKIEVAHMPHEQYRYERVYELLEEIVDWVEEGRDQPRLMGGERDPRTVAYLPDGEE